MREDRPPRASEFVAPFAQALGLLLAAAGALLLGVGLYYGPGGAHGGLGPLVVGAAGILAGATLAGAGLFARRSRARAASDRSASRPVV